MHILLFLHYIFLRPLPKVQLKARQKQLMCNYMMLAPSNRQCTSIIHDFRKIQ